MKIVFAEIYDMQEYGLEKIIKYLEDNNLYLVITNFMSCNSNLKKSTAYQKSQLTKHYKLIYNKKYYNEDLLKRLSKLLIGCNQWPAGSLGRFLKMRGCKINRFLEVFSEINPELAEIWEFNLSSKPDNEYFVRNPKDPFFENDYEEDQIPFIKIIHKEDKLI